MNWKTKLQVDKWFRRCYIPIMYLFFDCETGGIGSEYSLLTSYFLVTDKKFNVVDDLYLFLKPDDGIYRVCGEAMNVNRIDLKVHETRAIPYKEGGTKLYNFIKTYSKDGSDRLTCVGHNVNFDRDCVVHNLVSRNTWDNFCSYRLRDTAIASGYLIDCGIIPESSAGLGALVKYFGLVLDENQQHDAKYDVTQTLAVYKALVNLGIKLNI